MEEAIFVVANEEDQLFRSPVQIINDDADLKSAMRDNILMQMIIIASANLSSCSYNYALPICSRPPKIHLTSESWTRRGRFI